MSRLKAVPWIAVLAVLKVVLDYWLEIPAKDRKGAASDLWQSKGRPSRLSPEQRDRLRRVARAMRPGAMAYDAARSASSVPMPDLTGRKEKQRRSSGTA